MSPTPRDQAPAVVRRTELVEAVVEALEGIEELPIDEQLVRLGQAQETLSDVLHGADQSQLRITGLR